MKTFIQSILCASFSLLLAVSVSATPTVDSKSECKNNTCENFRVGMYRIKSTLTMNFLMEKQRGQRVTLRLLDGKGKVLHEEFVGKSVNKYGRKFNFSEMQDGHYTLEVSDANERITKELFLATNEVVDLSGRTLAMN